MKSYIALLLAFLACVASTIAFAPSVPATTSITTSSSQLQMTVLTYNGKKKDFKAGSPLKNAVAQLGVKPRYSCKKGECATCEIMLAGRMTRPCVAKVPPEPKLKSLQEKGLEIRA